MPQLEQWLRIMLLGSRVLEGVRMKRLAINIAWLLILAVLIGAMLATLLLIGLYAAYQLLLQQGASLGEALCMTAGLTILLLLLLALICRYRYRNIAQSMRYSGPGSQISEAAGAFIKGLRAPR